MSEFLTALLSSRLLDLGERPARFFRSDSSGAPLLGHMAACGTSNFRFCLGTRPLLLRTCAQAWASWACSFRSFYHLSVFMRLDLVD